MATTPTEIASPRPDGCLPISGKNVTSASEKPSRQFGLESSGDRRDIGYVRSGVAVVNPGNSFSGWVKIRLEQPEIPIKPFTPIRAPTRGLAICPWRKQQLI